MALYMASHGIPCQRRAFRGTQSCSSQQSLTGREEMLDKMIDQKGVREEEMLDEVKDRRKLKEGVC